MAADKNFRGMYSGMQSITMRELEDSKMLFFKYDFPPFFPID
jgi:hypothetical protein